MRLSRDPIKVKTMSYQLNNPQTSGGASARRQRFIYKILIVSALLIVVSFSVLGYWIYNVSSNTLISEIGQEVGSTGTSAADGIQKWLDGRLLLVRDLAEDITNSDSAEIPKLVKRPTFNQTFSEVYFGVDADGSFITSNTLPLPAGYDPRKRPWYDTAVKAKQIALTAPYVDATTKKLVISVVSPISRGGALQGVAGTDLPLDALQSFLRSLNLGGKGFVFLVDGEGTVLVHPDEQKIMKPFGIKPDAVVNADMQAEQGDAIVRFYPISGLPTVKWYVGVSMDRAKVLAPLETLRHTLLISVLASLLVIVPLLGWLITRLVAHPIVVMTRAMQALAKGDADQTIPGLDRKDEIGQMADALSVFRHNLLEKQALEEANAAAQHRAEAQKREMLDRLVTDFQRSVSHVVDAVAQSSGELRTAAQSMTTTSERTTHQSAAVARVVEGTSSNVQTVASASEQLAASIGEIARQVDQSTTIANHAAEQANRSSRSVEALAEAAQKIDQVVVMIQGIASQTNLLALNATIEAARAGEAGKGFAVVAAEVKALADQTARATQEIQTQVQGIQAATAEAVADIGSIGQTIGQINEITVAIAAAIEEQGAATGEISRNVQQAADGTREVSSNIADVSAAANQTDTAAGQVLSLATSLSSESDRLRQEVATFIQAVRST